MIGKKKLKARFEIKVEKIEGLPDKIKGNPFRVEYARGKDNTGISRSITMTSPNMSINYSFKFDCNVMFEEKKGVKKFSEKTLVFQVVAEKSKDVKKESNIAKCEFDLSTIVTPGEFTPRQRLECHGKDKKDIKCVLIVSFKTEILKIDGKKLVKVDSSKKPTSSTSTDTDLYSELPEFGSDEPGRRIEMDGQEYDLKTDTELSEAGPDSDGNDKTENDYLSDSDDKEDPFEEDAPLTEAEIKKAKQLEEDDTEHKKLEEEKKKKEEEKKKADEEKKKKEDEKKKADEEKKKADEEKKKADEEKKKADEEKKKADDEKKKADDEKKKKDDDKKKKEEEEKLAKEEEKKKKEEAEKARKEEEKRKKADKEAKEKAEKAEKEAKKKGLVLPVSSPVSPTSSTPSTATNQSTTSSGSSSAQVSELEKTIKDLEAKLNSANSARDKAEASVKQLKAELEAEKTTASELKKRVKVLEPKVNELTEEVESLQSKLEASSAGTSIASTATDSDVKRLESQLRQSRIEKQELQNALQEAENKLIAQQSAAENFDMEYAQKQYEKLETENTRLRTILDENGLLKGNLIQELKHRQSERDLRVLRHKEEVAAGIASETEITSYKPTHSRRGSMDSSSGSSLKSPRTDTTSKSTSSKKSGATKSTSKPTKNLGQKPKPVDDDPQSEDSLDDDIDNFDEQNSDDEVEDEPSPPPTKKKSSKTSKSKPNGVSSKNTDSELTSTSHISMEDDEPATSPSFSKRVNSNGNAPSATAVLDAEGFGSSDDSRVRDLESHIKHFDAIESYYYHAAQEYKNNASVPARKMAKYILNAQALDRNGQHSESSHALLVHVVKALYGQCTRHMNDIDVLMGMLVWGTTLLQVLTTDTDILEDAPSHSVLTWAKTIPENGLVSSFEAVVDAMDEMGKGKLNIEDSFDNFAADASPGEAFFRLLDSTISYIYVLIFVQMQQIIDPAKLPEMFFSQVSQLDGSHSSSKVSPAYKNMFYLTNHLDQFTTIAEKHQVPIPIFSQLLSQVFYWCSGVVINDLIDTPGRCCGASGMSLKVAVSHIESWTARHSQFKKQVNWMEQQLLVVREAANVLTIDKQIFQSIDMLETIFTVLNIAQIHKILQQFQPDDYSPESVPKITMDVLRSTILKTNVKIVKFDGTVLIPLKYVTNQGF